MEALGVSVHMGRPEKDMHACKLCSVVNKSVELYYYEEFEAQDKAWLCIGCQKKAFHFFVSMLILGAVTNFDSLKPCDYSTSAKKMQARVFTLAKKNHITTNYALKLVKRETERAIASMSKGEKND